MPRERNILEWDGFFKKHIWGGFTWNSKFSHRQPLPLHTNQYKLIQIALYSLYRVPSYLISSKKPLKLMGKQTKPPSTASAPPSHDSATPPPPQKAPLNWAQLGGMPLKEGPPRLGGWSPDPPWGLKLCWFEVVGSDFLLGGIYLEKNCSCLFIRSGSNTDVHDVYYKNLEIVWTLQNIIYSCPAVTFSHW